MIPPVRLDDLWPSNQPLNSQNRPLLVLKDLLRKSFCSLVRKLICELIHGLVRKLIRDLIRELVREQVLEL